MAVSESRVIDGITRAVWDDDTSTYTEYSANGQTVTLARAYTAVESELKAERDARATAGANSATLRAQAQAAIDELLADRAQLATLAATANATINGAPAAYVKGVGVALGHADKRLVQVIRLVAGLLGTTNSGS